MNKKSGSVKYVLSQNMNILIIAVVMVVFAVLGGLGRPTFFQSKNLITVMYQTVVTALTAMGVTFIMLIGGIDLSVGAIVGVSAIIMCKLNVSLGLNPVLCILICFLICMALGLFNGFLITTIKIPAFIATMAVSIILRGFCQKLTAGGSVYGIDNLILWLGGHRIGGIFPVAIAFGLIMLLVTWFVLRKTKFGMCVYASGGNSTAAKLSGIQVTKVHFACYVIAGIFYALAAIVYIGRQGAALETTGNGFELDAVTAAAIGGVAFCGGRGNVVGTTVGALFVQIIMNLMGLYELSEFAQKIVIGAVIVLAAGSDYFRRLLAEKKKTLTALARKEDV